MKRYASGTKVGQGFYWNVGRWELANIPAGGGELAGEAGDGFVKLPFLLALVIAPLMGLLYVMFLPFIGFAMLLATIVKGVARGVHRLVVGTAAVVHPAWRPGEAYLTGEKHDEKKKEGEPRKDAALDALSREVEKRRNDEH